MSNDPIAIEAYYDDTHFTVGLDDGRFLCVPFDYSSRLALATKGQRRFFHIMNKGTGLRWPDIDEDLSVAGIIRNFKKKGILVDPPDYDMLEGDE